MSGVKSLLGDRLFGTQPHKLVRRSDPDTSRAAANLLNTTDSEREVYNAVVTFVEGCTADELMARFPNQQRDSIVPRLAPLIRKGYLEDTGLRRNGRSGRQQRVVRARG